jgi:hypothetical protein
MLLIFSSTSLALTSFSNMEYQMNHHLLETKPIPLTQSNGWMKTFGGNDYDEGNSVKQTNDGGYIITGHTYSFGSSISYNDIWLIKTDSNGNEVWNRTFGGNAYDEGRSVQQTVDGGYVLAGETDSYGSGHKDFWLVKTDSSGNEQWNKTFGGTSSDYAYSVQQTIDEGYIIIGKTFSYGAGNGDVWLIKTDSNGNEVWNRTFGGKNDDNGIFVRQTTDEGYIITGDTKSFGAGRFDVWLIKTDDNGDEVWNRTFGGNDTDRGYSVQQTSDRGYVIAGSTESFGGGRFDVWLIKTDDNGDEVWNKTFGWINRDGGRFVQQTTDGGYIITGNVDDFWGGFSDVWLIKTDSNGDKVWDRIFRVTDGYDYGNSVQQTNDGGYIITGKASPFDTYNVDIVLIKTDSKGKSKIFISYDMYLKKLIFRFPILEKILNQIIL